MTRIIIKAIAERGEFVKYLKDRLPQAEWCFDQKRDAMDTFLRGCKMAGNDPVLFLEEDVILTRDFVAKAEAAIAERPHEQIQFFSMRKADIEVGSRYDRKFMMNQCHYMPAGACADLLAYSAVWPDRPQHPFGYDTMMQAWHKARNIRYWIHVPSLVEHRIAKSMIDHRRSSKRQSKTFRDPWG